MQEDLIFEAALKQLEGAIARLEQGQMPLGEATDWFEKGGKNANLCSRMLHKVESRVTILTEHSNDIFETEQVLFDVS